MRVLLVGAAGVIGRRLVPQLLAAGHEVVGTTRSSERGQALRAAGAEPVLLDALDRDAVRDAVAAARADALINQLTSIPARIDPRRLRRDFALNDRLRSESTASLVDAARAAGVARILAQSVAFAYAPGPPGAVHVERDPLISAEQAGPAFARSAAAIRSLETTVLDAAGIVLRYGYFYGSGSAIARDGSVGQDVARRRLPVVGGGAGVWSFVHVDDAAAATVAALERGGPAVYNVVDDEPATVRDWVPALARALDAKPPRNVPAWLARPLAGEYGVSVMTEAQGASNALAQHELGWQPAHASWREGFRTALG